VWLCGHTRHCCTRRDIFDHHRPAPDHRPCTDLDIEHDAGTDADEDVGLDPGATAEDAAGCDVDILTDIAFVLDDGAGVDDGVVGDGGPRVDDRAGSDKDARAKAGGDGDDRARVNDGRGGFAQRAKPRDECAAGRGVADGDDAGGARGGTGGQDRFKIGERAKTIKGTGAGSKGRGRGIVEEADGHHAEQGGGFGNTEGVAATAEDDEVGDGHRFARSGEKSLQDLFSGEVVVAFQITKQRVERPNSKRAVIWYGDLLFTIDDRSQTHMATPLAYFDAPKRG